MPIARPKSIEKWSWRWVIEEPLRLACQSKPLVDLFPPRRYLRGMTKKTQTKKLSYADAGVDIDAGDEAVARIKKLAKATFTDGVMSEIGSFGGFFKPDLGAYSKPILISSADGVGTKLKLAFMTGVHNTVGQDLVNHCINDILVHGAKALFFLDYIATGKLDPSVIAEVVEGLSVSCRNAGVALLGGETAEMPDFYSPGEYDVAGFIIGMVDEPKVINGSTIKKGDICLGLESDGLHTNGYTLARKIAFDVAGLNPDDRVEGLELTIGEELMRVHRCYANPIHSLLARHEVHGMAHITGGGLPGNLSRIIPDGLSAEINLKSWQPGAIFQWLMEAGDVDSFEMYRAFNMGVGFVLVVPPSEVGGVIGDMTASGETAWELGEIVTGEKAVRLI